MSYTIVMLIALVMFTNGYYAGKYKEQSSDWSKDKRVAVVVFAYYATFAFIDRTIALIYRVIKIPVSKALSFFQIPFLFSFYLSRKWNNLSKDNLRSLNDGANTFHATNSIRHRIYRHCVEMVNSRNNYCNNNQASEE